MRRTFFFIVAVCLATSSFASIPRASALDVSSPRFDPLPETRIRVSADLAPFEPPAGSELTRALRQGYEQASTTNASGLARFLSVDPTWESADLGKPQSWNRYSYVQNNPVNMTDPDGKVGIDPIELAKAVWATTAEFTTEYVIDAPKTGGDLPKDPVERAKYIEQNLKADSPYQRPSGATTPQQRASVQNKPCEVCGKDDGAKRVAGHKKALVQEHFETGKIDKEKMKALDAVRPECPTCSAREGAAMSRYSRVMKNALKELFKKLL